MTKLLNKKTIQYIKQGQVLYGQNGLNIKQFNKDSYTLLELKKSIYKYLDSFDYPEEYKNKLYNNFLNKNFIIRPGTSDYYVKRTSKEGQQILLESRLKPDSKYKEFFRDPQTGRLYRKVKKEIYVYTPDQNQTTSWNSTSRFDTTYSYEPVSKDILDENGKVLLKAYENGNFGKYHTDQDVAYGNWKGQKIAVRYNKDSKTWMYVPVNNRNSKWMKADQDLSKYLNSLDYFSKTPNNTDGKNTNNTGGENTDNTSEENTNNTGGNVGGNNNQANSGAAPEGPPTSNFEALNMETDRRTIVPSVVSQLQVSQSSPSVRLLPKVKPVARPKDMPLMNRSDVRYTINDVTGDSPYFSSDIELVNGLAKTPDDNMFKQALMNRLGMDKWDNSTALNRLNYLGIKGNIGGSDRKRLRNLINKGTTIEGTIRKKQGGKLKLIKRYG